MNQYFPDMTDCYIHELTTALVAYKRSSYSTFHHRRWGKGLMSPPSLIEELVRAEWCLVGRLLS